ncbi:MULTISPECIES: efflux RND transporter periplasmic adaptor subunit [unclassified Arcicella]|jgi:cobalt-zinc-cadmium efflux system membrane fusion protein|uniref:efflux RND transporter periplasmic adaptor subunit n=1 Tax=unclassified Arcicella TaxID=2644986 RepID=UPI002867545F|nr:MULTISPECIES: efflux RND transporter periplasmic adaptor subunit [unclassified Arcicella]MCA6439180.1 efflux RND transporter periplasmic adaptor subunit [Chitinophagaceae bacterium]MCA6447575.1 efflux RND transporter periplasmic adaptor subunit [Chitinophagaceae bacterium]MDR6561513.1 RND family efflux transporter MFP subunit [Arcicella sp. BE51]MDR6811397.1 RND family efflux transporter MFP subunit [Arcicella sp. BE140]MDR6822747.1 RND family efflux transporter MFP subunit [Arcicella sp. B
MNNISKIFLAAIFAVSLTACGDSKKEESADGDNHKHKTEEKAEKAHSEPEAEEGSATVAALTPQQIEAVGIKYGVVEMKELTATIKANGILSLPNNSKANATSLYGGVIRTLNVQIGDYVRKGQVIATIANPQFIQLQEEYLTINSKITFAEQEMQRQKDLNAGNAGAMKNLQNATAELNALRTRKASLHQQIQLMGINPNTVSNSSLKSSLVVTSPISGAISNVYGKIGSYVDVSSPVAEIVDNNSLHLHLNIFEKDLPMLKVGQTIHFTLTNNPVNEYDAVVYGIGSAFENESKTVPIHARVKGNIKGLIDGMNITAIVSLNNVLSPAVPNDAIVDADGKKYIFVITNKKPQEAEEEGHGHSHDDEKTPHKEEVANTVNFEKIEVIAGVTEMGFTAITPVNEIPKDARIVTKGAFFINAKLSGGGGDAHAH